MRNKEEQALFEIWAMSAGAYSLSRDIDGSYINGKTRCAFRAWLGRSKIQKPAPECPVCQAALASKESAGQDLIQHNQNGRK